MTNFPSAQMNEYLSSLVVKTVYTREGNQKAVLSTVRENIQTLAGNFDIAKEQEKIRQLGEIIKRNNGPLISPENKAAIKRIMDM